jgi:D-serine deaminase-like pyridoxal phosphate-dependent protein
MGAKGICVAKLGEAEVMLEAGLDDVFLANVMLGPDKARRAATIAQRIQFTVGVDHPLQADQLSAALQDKERLISVLVEVDSGSGRGGAPVNDIPELLRRIRDLPGLELRGLYTYEGFTYGAASVSEMATRHREAQCLMVNLAKECREAFTMPPVVSMGSTPSLLADIDLIPGITEIRPGTSIFLDAAQATLAGGVHHGAAHVLATVVSRHGDRAILDSGSKALTSDSRGGGVCATRGKGLLVDYNLMIERLSEEHGVLEGLGVEQLTVGEKVWVLPNHICPAVNLFEQMHLVRDGVVERVLPVAARGRLV